MGAIFEFLPPQLYRYFQVSVYDEIVPPTTYGARRDNYDDVNSNFGGYFHCGDFRDAIARLSYEVSIHVDRCVYPTHILCRQLNIN